MKFEALIFDFDGVLIESEHVSGVALARILSELGYPTSVQEALDHFTGLSGCNFHSAVARWIGRPIPAAFHHARALEDRRVMDEGLNAVVGAVAFVHQLAPDLPRAVASSSTTLWITRHLDHIGLRAAFGDHIYSGREHVTRGKPAPDIYLHAAAAIGADIARTLIIEDSVVGARGAVASGATVVGLAAGLHCNDGHADKLRTEGVHHIAHSFDEVAALLAL
jgi:beta-phosphoglucomutase-like phosphatase (HAD superfamily)